MIATLKKIPFIKKISEIGAISSIYHFGMVFIAALRHGFPARKLVVIGVTGTKGKTSTSNFIAQILSDSGLHVALATTVNFKIGEKEWVNQTKQTMLGRSALQSFLQRAVKEGVTHAVIETSSEGILQHRHRFLNYQIGVFTNLSPEHIERHGSFENYRASKGELFKLVSRAKKGVAVINGDDESAAYFLKPTTPKQIVFGYKDRGKIGDLMKTNTNPQEGLLFAENVHVSPQGLAFTLGGAIYEASLVGEFNLGNVLAAIGVAQALHIPQEKIQESVKKIQAPSGRFEIVAKDPFLVVVDYAHEPASLAALYEAVKLFHPRKIIGVLGSQGGGRDRAKRSGMGEIAGRYADQVVVTDEDPYDENPTEIIKDVALGAERAKHAEVHQVLDRREGIKKALSFATPGDAVVISGKGGEVFMCVAGDKKIPWSDREVVEEILKNK